MSTSRKHLLTTLMPVRWGDMDAYGHVNNTVYFRYFEQARIEWIEKMGFPVGPQAETGPIIVTADCSFMLPVVYPATVRIDVSASHPGRSSFMTHYALYVEGDERLYAEGSAKIVWIDTRQNRAVAFPDSLRALLMVHDGPDADKKIG